MENRKGLSVITTEVILGMELRVYGDKETPLFLAKDIAERIEYDKSSVNKMINGVDDVEKVRNIIPTPGGMQETWFLTEDGVYEVLMTSRKPIAKEFRKGFKEFLKAWRKGEVKVVPTQTEEDMLIQLFPESNIELIQAMANGIRERRQLAQQVEVAHRRIDKANDSLIGANGDTSRERLNLLVKSVGAQYCEFNKIMNMPSNQSSIYMNIYRHFAKTVGLSFSEIEGWRKKFKKNGEIAKTKKSYIEAIEENGYAERLLHFVKTVIISEI